MKIQAIRTLNGYPPMNRVKRQETPTPEIVEVPFKGKEEPKVEELSFLGKLINIPTIEPPKSLGKSTRALKELTSDDYIEVFRVLS